MKGKLQQMRAKRFLLTIAGLALLAFVPGLAKADSVTLTLEPSHTIGPGGSVSFFGTIVNTGSSNVFLNDLSVTLTGPGGLTFDSSPFIANTPAFLVPGGSVGAVTFFDVFADLTVPFGAYSGSITLLGGADGNTFDELGTRDFTVNVVPTPEPASMVLLGTGLGGAFIARRRRKRNASQA